MDKYEEALRKLIEDEVITSKALKRITGLDMEEPTDDTKEAARLLHTMLCDKVSDECQFFDEEMFDDCWEKPEHKQWLALAEKDTKIYGLSRRDYLRVVTKAVAGMQSVSALPEAALSLLVSFIRAHLRQVRRSAIAPAHKDDQVSELEGEVSDQELD